MYSTISQMNYESLAAPPLPPSMTTIFGSILRSGRLTVPSKLHLKSSVRGNEAGSDRGAVPRQARFLVAETLCGSVEVLLPEGATVVDHTTSMFSSHKVSQDSQEHGLVIHLDGLTCAAT